MKVQEGEEGQKELGSMTLQSGHDRDYNMRKMGSGPTEVEEDS